MAFIRKVKTKSGATAVQIIHKAHGKVDSLEHIGSAHTDKQLALLTALAKQRILGGQQALFSDPAEATSRISLKSSHSGLLLRALISQYYLLGFEALSDEDFMHLCVARIVEPSSKLDSLRVLSDLGISVSNEDRLYRCLKRVIASNYRDKLSNLCFAYASIGTGVSLVLYDVTTLYFEIQKEDQPDEDTNTPGYRKPGMSKERRLEPQITVGLLVDQNGFPLELHSFEGNKAETKTILPVIEAFRTRHGLLGITVVADAGMLSASNLVELTSAGYSYIVGSRMNKIPYSITEFTTKQRARLKLKPDDEFTLADNQIITSKTAITNQRIIYQYRAKRAALDLRNIAKQVEKAEKIASGKTTAKKAKFLITTTSEKKLNQALIDKAKTLAGIKGYVTNLPENQANNLQVIGYYHQLWRVEQSFRMSKSDLQARPIFHQTKDAIEAHLTIVLAALAMSRRIQQKTGLSIRRVVNTLKPIRGGVITLNGADYVIEPDIPASAKDLLRSLRS